MRQDRTRARLQNPTNLDSFTENGGPCVGRHFFVRLFIAMYCGWRKCRHADRDIFCRFLRSGILDPFSSMRNHSLSSGHIEGSILVCHPESSAQDNCVLLKLRRLSWFLPSRRAAHVGHAYIPTFCVHASYVFINQFGFISGRFNAGCTLNQSRQFHPPLLSNAF